VGVGNLGNRLPIATPRKVHGRKSVFDCGLCREEPIAHCHAIRQEERLLGSPA
jgi:hypothetical protein